MAYNLLYLTSCTFGRTLLQSPVWDIPYVGAHRECGEKILVFIWWWFAVTVEVASGAEFLCWIFSCLFHRLKTLKVLQGAIVVSSGGSYDEAVSTSFDLCLSYQYVLWLCEHTYTVCPTYMFHTYTVCSTSMFHYSRAHIRSVQPICSIIREPTYTKCPTNMLRASRAY